MNDTVENIQLKIDKYILQLFKSVRAYSNSSITEVEDVTLGITNAYGNVVQAVLQLDDLDLTKAMQLHHIARLTEVLGERRRSIF